MLQKFCFTVCPASLSYFSLVPVHASLTVSALASPLFSIHPPLTSCLLYPPVCLLLCLPPIPKFSSMESSGSTLFPFWCMVGPFCPLQSPQVPAVAGTEQSLASSYMGCPCSTPSSCKSPASCAQNRVDSLDLVLYM